MHGTVGVVSVKIHSEARGQRDLQFVSGLQEPGFVCAATKGALTTIRLETIQQNPNIAARCRGRSCFRVGLGLFRQ